MVTGVKQLTSSSNFFLQIFRVCWRTTPWLPRAVVGSERSWSNFWSLGDHHEIHQWQWYITTSQRISNAWKIAKVWQFFNWIGITIYTLCLRVLLHIGLRGLWVPSVIWKFTSQTWRRFVWRRNGEMRFARVFASWAMLQSSVSIWKRLHICILSDGDVKIAS